MRFVRWLDDHFEETLMVIFLSLITVVMITQVILRYFFSSPLFWAEEFCRYGLIWSTFISIGYCTKKGIMLKVDTILKLLPKVVQYSIELIIKMIVITFYGIFLVASFGSVYRTYLSNQYSAAMEVPMYIVYSITIPGFLFGVIRSIQDLIQYTIRLVKKKDEKQDQEVA